MIGSQYETKVEGERYPIFNVGAYAKKHGSLYEVSGNRYHENKAHDPVVDGHHWHYFRGDWFDTMRQCKGCKRTELHLRCETLGGWVASLGDIGDAGAQRRAWNSLAHLGLQHRFPLDAPPNPRVPCTATYEVKP